MAACRRRKCCPAAATPPPPADRTWTTLSRTAARRWSAAYPSHSLAGRARTPETRRQNRAPTRWHWPRAPRRLASPWLCPQEVPRSRERSRRRNTPGHAATLRPPPLPSSRVLLAPLAAAAPAADSDLANCYPTVRIETPPALRPG